MRGKTSGAPPSPFSSPSLGGGSSIDALEIVFSAEIILGLRLIEPQRERSHVYQCAVSAVDGGIPISGDRARFIEYRLVGEIDRRGHQGEILAQTRQVYVRMWKRTPAVRFRLRAELKSRTLLFNRKELEREADTFRALCHMSICGENCCL